MEFSRADLHFWAELVRLVPDRLPLYPRWVGLFTRHLATLGLVAAATLISPEVHFGMTVIVYYIPVWIALRFIGIAQAWLAFVVVVAALAWRFPPDGSFAIEALHRPRFFGNVVALLLMIASRSGSFGSIERALSRRLRRIKVWLFVMRLRRQSGRPTERRPLSDGRRRRETPGRANKSTRSPPGRRR